MRECGAESDCYGAIDRLRADRSVESFRQGDSFCDDILVLDSRPRINTIEHMSYPWIRASEIGDYIYCRRAWWLRRVRAVASNNVTQLHAGTQHHEQHGRLVQQSIWLRRLAYVVLFCAVAVLVFQLLTGSGG